MLHLSYFLGVRGGGFRSSLLQENEEEVIEDHDVIYSQIGVTILLKIRIDTRFKSVH